MVITRKIISSLVVTLFFLLILAVTLQVVSRILSITMPWTEEMARFLFIWLAFIGGYFTIRRGVNITFDLVIDMLPQSIWKVVFTGLNVVSVLFLGLVGYLGINLSILNMTNLSPVMGVPYGYIYFALPIGALVMIFAQIETYLILIKKRNEELC
ncbi:TRAP transporter small permease [Alkalihalobacillus sp. BA299]|uniref:TRAP transporter small permease n=1 Tax=Alkalihalobacillus sp. BA299 TaxID=2815938 RepID=UPI001ADC162C|nr:TRAP transporter small permease [Alkalihalobacillus sp. BA299]